MKQNEARLVFRVLAFLIAVSAWIVTVAMCLEFLLQGDSPSLENWWFLYVSVFFAIAFTLVAFTGRVPKVLIRIWPSQGGLGTFMPEDKDLR
jgi:hypothetical protein